VARLVRWWVRYREPLHALVVVVLIAIFVGLIIYAFVTGDSRGANTGAGGQ
jgi:hypothetical protein